MASTAGKQKAGSDERQRLLKELRALIKEVDEEGLRFLIRQATTIIHNMKVDELNRVRAEADEQERSARRRKGERTAAEEGSPSVFFEAGKRSGGYIMEIDGVRAIMDEAEVLQLVRIAQKADSPEAARRQLYRWIDANRDDILMEVELNPNGGRMKALYARLVTDFAIR